MTSFDRLQDPAFDLVIVGSGILGLAHAVAAVERGMSVAVIERDAHPVGASVRNFGHAGFTAQSGQALAYARASRPVWLRLATEADFWARDCGTLVVARAHDEYAVLDEFATLRGNEVELLGRRDVQARIPCGDDVVGGAFFNQDLRVDPRAALPAIADWLASKHGVEFFWRTSVGSLENGAVHTSRGTVRAGQIVVAVGHDLDYLFPDLAQDKLVHRCVLQMLQVSIPGAPMVAPAVLSGTSLLRYAGFGECPTLPRVEERMRSQHRLLLDADVNLMLTQRPDGDLVIGDTHTYLETADAFRAEALDELLLQESAALLGYPARSLRVRKRWQGVYAWSPVTPFINATPLPGVRVAAVTSGIGMTTAFGFADSIITELCQ